MMSCPRSGVLSTCGGVPGQILIGAMATACPGRMRRMRRTPVWGARVLIRGCAAMSTFCETCQGNFTSTVGMLESIPIRWGSMAGFYSSVHLQRKQDHLHTHATQKSQHVAGARPLTHVLPAGLDLVFEHIHGKNRLEPPSWVVEGMVMNPLPGLLGRHCKDGPRP